MVKTPMIVISENITQGVTRSWHSKNMTVATRCCNYSRYGRRRIRRTNRFTHAMFTPAALV
jgi:hypothetical protein